MGPIIPFGKIIFALNVYLKVRFFAKKKKAKKFFPFVPQLPHINFVTQLCHSFNF